MSINNNFQTTYNKVNFKITYIHILIQVLLDAFPSRDPNALEISKINIADKKDKHLMALAPSNYDETIESFWKRHPWLYFPTNMLRMKMENMLSSPSW